MGAEASGRRSSRVKASSPWAGCGRAAGPRTAGACFQPLPRHWTGTRGNELGRKSRRRDGRDPFCFFLGLGQEDAMSPLSRVRLQRANNVIK